MIKMKFFSKNFSTRKFLKYNDNYLIREISKQMRLKVKLIILKKILKL